METVLKPSNYNYFPESDRITNTDGSNSNHTYEFLSFHPVSASSEMVGTSIEELLMHNFPNKKSWECSRLCNFPQEIILRLNYRSHMKYITLKAKVNRPITELEIYLADGVDGNFNDCTYRRVAKVKSINEDGSTIKIDGIGNYVKLVFTKPSIKTQDNPFGQISVAQFKIFGKKINHLLFYDNIEDDHSNKEAIDKILIKLGLPLNDPYFLVNDENYQIAPVDEDTKVTLKDMLIILRSADKSKDYEMMKRVKTDIKTVYYIGNEILNMERKLDIAKSRDDYDTCIKLRKQIEDVIKKRDNYDAVYETSRYENMIVMKRPSTADMLREEEERLRLARERLQKEKLDREKLEREKQRKEREDELNKLYTKTVKMVDNTSKRVVEYVPQKNKKKEDDFSDELQYNQGDRDLEPYFPPLARNAGGNIPPPDISKLRKALRQGTLTVTGVRLYSAMICDNWKMREAAVKALLEFIENPLISRYSTKTLSLFLTCIEMSKYACEDKVVQIYLEGLKILGTCLAPPICGNDVDPNLIQKSVQWFIPKYIKKISELNYRARDLTMNTLISIFKHPALNIGDLIKGCMDIVERQDGVTPDKQPWNTLLARLEIILHTLEDNGIDESLWDWYPVFTELIIPSLFHQNPDCRMVSVEICVLLYKLVGDDIKIIINDLNNLKPNLKESINIRISEVDLMLKKDIQHEQEKVKTSIDKTNLKLANNENESENLEENTNTNNENKNKLFNPKKKRNANDVSLESILESNLEKENFEK